MSAPKQEAQSALFYDFSIEDYVPYNHILRAIDGVIDLSGVRQHLSEFDSTTGRPSVDPKLMMRKKQSCKGRTIDPFGLKVDDEQFS